jgi:hypothetical protein
MKKSLLAAAFVLFGTILTGCAGGYRYSYGYAGYGPPAPRYRVIGVAPGPGYVWVNGYWGWRGSRGPVGPSSSRAHRVGGWRLAP